MLCNVKRDLDASIFTDPPLAKKVAQHFKKAGIRMLSSVFFVDEHGRYEIHVTVKSEKGNCIQTRKVAELLSVCTKRRMCPAQNERQVLGQEYETIECVEGPGYYVLQGVAKMGKNGQKISGDSFLMKTLPCGKEAAILSDGMGSGERALQESGMLVEMLEELLGAGFPVETALSMINTALVMGREEVRFSTVDMSIFDDAKHLCSWCGLSPANNESAGKKKSVRIAKAGDYLKPMMVQCALAAIKSKKQPYFAIKYGRIKKRRGHKKAIIAIARMMIVCIYHMISEKKPFSPTDYEELMDPQNHVERVVLTENNVFAYLESLGYDSSKLVKRNDN